MTNSTIENEIFTDKDKKNFQDQMCYFIQPKIEKFEKVLKKFLLLNLFFALLITIELLYFFVHLTFLIQTFALAIH